MPADEFTYRADGEIRKISKKFIKTWIKEIGEEASSKWAKQSNPDLQPSDFYIYGLCEEYNKNQSERSVMALESIIDAHSFRMKQIFEIINKDFLDEFKNKILAYSL